MQDPSKIEHQPQWQRPLNSTTKASQDQLIRLDLRNLCFTLNALSIWCVIIDHLYIIFQGIAL